MPVSTAPSAPRSVPDTLLGILGAAMLLTAVVVMLRGGPSDSSGPVGAPAVTVLEPTPGAVLAGALEVVFRPEREIRQMPSGWGVEGLHLHLQVDDVSYMPAGADIQPLGSGAYRWSFGRLAPGEHTLRLFWSDANHRAVGGGGSPPVRVRAP